MTQGEHALVVDRDVPVPMDDGVVLRADVFRPATGGPWPVVMTAGPYGKGIPFREGVFSERYQRLLSEHPEVLEGSSGAHLCWETLDPEHWVPAGYAVVRVDSRGAGRSPGTMDLLSPREMRDFALAIEWAASQAWCSGKVGLLGVSYYAITQWLVAALRPPHLAAIIPWEGASDHYRDMSHHGGVLSNGFFDGWYPRQVLSIQHGLGAAGPASPWVDDGMAAGPETLSVDELASRRADYLGELKARALDDRWHQDRSAALDRIEVPVLSSANWGGLGLHSRGNFEGFCGVSSEHRWLDVHTGRHEEEFYLPGGRALQRAFFDRFLLGRENGWEARDRVSFVVRRAGDPGAAERRAGAADWPLPGTRWERWFLGGADRLCGPAAGPPEEAGDVGFPAGGSGATFVSAPLERPCTLVGPAVARIAVATSGQDADVFCTLRAFLADGEEVTFRGANDPRAPLSQGWLRLSQRELDLARSLPHRPWYTHQRVSDVRPGTVYEVDVELWPTCVHLPARARLALTVGGSDFSRPGSTGPFSGSGPFRHDDEADRRSLRGIGMTVHTGGRAPSWVMLPVVDLPGVA